MLEAIEIRRRSSSKRTDLGRAVHLSTRPGIDSWRELSGTGLAKTAAGLAVGLGGALLLTALSSCNTASGFTCDGNAGCGDGGVCQPNGACSFEDDECPSGQRYGEHSKPGIALECVPVEDIATGSGTVTTSTPTATSTSSSTASSTLSTTSTTTNDTITSSTTSMGLTMSAGSGSTSTTDPTTEGSDTTTGSSSSSTGEPIDPSLVMWFRFEDLPTQNIADSTDNGFVGECSGAQCPTAIDGPLGTAALFDGEDDEISVNVSDVAFGDEALTAAVWIRTDALEGEGRRMVFGHPFGNSIRNSWVLFFTENMATPPVWTVGFSMNSDIDGAQATYVVAVPFELGEWVHIAGTYADNQSNFYIDGTRIGGLVASPPLFDDHPITIGYDINNNNAVGHFVGAIDDVRLYDRALTDEEIAALAAP